MQRVARRTLQAEKQAKRRANTIKKKITAKDRREAAAEKGVAKGVFKSHIAGALKIRREEWERGPLSPFKDVRGFRDGFGIVRPKALASPKVTRADRRDTVFIRTGDRVVVVEGREGVKGHIGEVVRYDEEHDTVSIKGVNVVDRLFPEDLGGAGLVPLEAAIPMSAVRLVYPLPDPNTGVPRDVIISKLVKRESYFDPFENKDKWSRFLMPQNIRIPWPEEKETEKIDQLKDTLRIDAEEKTFWPTLLRPPMPLGVVDEIRNKYSIFRSRHEDEYIARKMAEDADEAAREDFKKSLMPQGARNLARSGRRKDAESTGPVLSPEMLANIGRYMAQKRPKETQDTLP